jgi:hypothetical protein
MILRLSQGKLLSVAVMAASFSLSLTAQTKPLFTETFESGKIDPAVWETRAISTVTIAVEPVDGAHGKFALHVHYPADAARNSYAFIVNAHLPEAVKNHFFGRAYVYAKSDLGMGHNPLIFAGEPGYPLSKFTEIGMYKGTWQPSYQENKSAQGQGRGEVTYHAETGPPVGKWFLLEWEFNDNPASITYWVNGEKILTPVGPEKEKKESVTFEWPKNSGTTSGLIGASGYQELGVGARVWGTSANGFDLYYDDIAIGTTRLGPVK